MLRLHRHSHEKVLVCIALRRATLSARRWAPRVRMCLPAALDRLRWASAAATGFRGGPEASSFSTKGCFMRRSFLISPWAKARDSFLALMVCTYSTNKKPRQWSQGLWSAAQGAGGRLSAVAGCVKTQSSRGGGQWSGGSEQGNKHSGDLQGGFSGGRCARCGLKQERRDCVDVPEA